MRRITILMLLACSAVLAPGCISIHALHNRQIYKFSCGKHAACAFDGGKLKARFCVLCGEPLLDDTVHRKP